MKQTAHFDGSGVRVYPDNENQFQNVAKEDA